MGKRINNDAITIKTLMRKGYTQAPICRMLGLKKQKVSYWANTPINMEIKRPTKLNEEYKFLCLLFIFCKYIYLWTHNNFLNFIWNQLLQLK